MSGHDEITCEMELPVRDILPGTLFRTRAFEGCFSEPYTITADGRLFCSGELGVHLPHALRPTLNRDHRSQGEPLETTTDGVEIAFNGDVDLTEFTDKARRFYACFIDGRCVRIVTEADYRDLMEKARRWALSLEGS